MKKNAFTLIEILAVIVLLGVLAIMVTTASTRLLNNSKQSLYDTQLNTILEAARKLNDGEYSKEIITTSLGYHVIFRESSSEKPSLEDKKDEITETLANEKLSDDQTLQVTALDELRKEYGMTINDTDIADKYSAYIANQIASIKAQSSSN